MAEQLKERINSIDIARGIIMVIMALDHVRDYVHVDAFNFDPTDLTRTTPTLFFTRWITHFCMPTFVFLSGVAIYRNRLSQTPKSMAWYLFTRGVWLVVLEFVVLRFGYFFNFYFDVTFLSVLWLFGMCMIFFAALIFLPYRWLVILGAVIVVGHSASALVAFEPGSVGGVVWTILMRVGFLPVTPEHAFIVSYPVIPWLGLMLLGYGVGKVFTWEAERRVKWLWRAGLVVVVLFAGLRVLNVYGGDPRVWQTQETPLLTLMSFLNVTKYPVSLLFMLMTIGPLLWLMAWLDGKTFTWLKPVHIIGRVPLFYFILHFYLIHAIALVMSMMKTGVPLAEVDFHFGKTFGGVLPEGRFSLGVVYLVWMGVVLMLYPLCKWYDTYKTRHRGWTRFF